MHRDLELQSIVDHDAANSRRALDIRPGRLQCKRLQKTASSSGRDRRSTRELEIPSSREDDATLHDV